MKTKNKKFWKLSVSGIDRKGNKRKSLTPKQLHNDKEKLIRTKNSNRNLEIRIFNKITRKLLKKGLQGKTFNVYKLRIGDSWKKVIFVPEPFAVVDNGSEVSYKSIESYASSNVIEYYLNSLDITLNDLVDFLPLIGTHEVKLNLKEEIEDDSMKIYGGYRVTKKHNFARFYNKKPCKTIAKKTSRAREREYMNKLNRDTALFDSKFPKDHALAKSISWCVM